MIFFFFLVIGYLTCFIGMIIAPTGLKRKKSNTKKRSKIGAEKMSKSLDIACNHVTMQVPVKS